MKAKENLRSLLYAEGSIVSKDEEKANIVNAFFAPIKEQFNKYQVPEPEDRDEEENETTMTQRKQPATPLGHAQVYGGRWDPPKGAEGAGGSAQQALFHHSLAAKTNQGCHG